MNQTAILNHEFLIAAYTLTWVIQLGYLARLAIKWRSLKKNSR